VSSFLEPEIWGTVQLGAVITVVDAEQALALSDDEARLARAQVAGGDLVILNKVDLVAPAKLASAVELVLQLVGRRATVSVSGLWGDEMPRTHLVFIARLGTVNFAAVEAALARCVASADREPVLP